jgi:hypothetical protein
MIMQIELQLSKCTMLVQCDVKIWFQSIGQEDSCLQVEASSKSLVWHDL